MEVTSCQEPTAVRLAEVTVETVVALTGELDASVADLVVRHVTRGASGADVVWIDAQQLRFIDCAGARALISAKEQLELSGAVATIRFSRPSSVARVFEFVGLSDSPSSGERQLPDVSSPSPLADAAPPRDQVEHLRRAVESRDVIGQAKGLLMAKTGCSADDAFDLLRAQSQYENRKLVDVAAAIVELQRRPRPAVPVSEPGAAAGPSRH